MADDSTRAISQVRMMKKTWLGDSDLKMKYIHEIQYSYTCIDWNEYSVWLCIIHPILAYVHFQVCSSNNSKTAILAIMYRYIYIRAGVFFKPYISACLSETPMEALARAEKGWFHLYILKPHYLENIFKCRKSCCLYAWANLTKMLLNLDVNFEVLYVQVNNSYCDRKHRITERDNIVQGILVYLVLFDRLSSCIWR